MPFPSDFLSEPLTIGSALALLFALAVGHALADFPLQGEFLAKGKNRNSPPPILASGDNPPKYIWAYCLTMHALIHGGFVWLIIGNVWYGLAEFVLHWLIDVAKCEELTTFETDQLLHLLTKVVFIGLIWMGIH